jgi:hypothetical protein
LHQHGAQTSEEPEVRAGAEDEHHALGEQLPLVRRPEGGYLFYRSSEGRAAAFESSARDTEPNHKIAARGISSLGRMLSRVRAGLMNMREDVHS